MANGAAREPRHCRAASNRLGDSGEAREATGAGHARRGAGADEAQRTVVTRAAASRREQPAGVAVQPCGAQPRKAVAGAIRAERTQGPSNTSEPVSRHWGSKWHADERTETQKKTAQKSAQIHTGSSVGRRHPRRSTLAQPARAPWTLTDSTRRPSRTAPAPSTPGLHTRTNTEGIRVRIHGIQAQ